MFLKRCNKKLLEGRSSSNPGSMIFIETLMDIDLPNGKVGKQNLHLRTEEWYLEKFTKCNFKV